MLFYFYYFDFQFCDLKPLIFPGPRPKALGPGKIEVLNTKSKIKIIKNKKPLINLKTK
jgi:hypothetical protein